VHKSRAGLIACVCFSISLSGCTGGDDPSADPDPESELPTLTKITFDLDLLNDDGLIGPPAGLRSVMYEFCVPDDSASTAEVRKIDSTIRIRATSPGRVGCSANQVLCIGETHQPGWRTVLEQLSMLEYIDRIDQSFAE
jgi:hypothetical protein